MQESVSKAGEETYQTLDRRGSATMTGQIRHRVQATTRAIETKAGRGEETERETEEEVSRKQQKKKKKKPQRCNNGPQ